MKIKTRLALQFTLVIAGILILFSVFVYFFWSVTQQAKYRDNLLRRARNTGTLFFNIPEIDSVELRNIHRNTLSWRNEEIVIADSSLNIIYSNRASYLTKETIRANAGQTEIQFFKIREKDGVRFSKRENGRYYQVFVMAFDRVRAENLAHLLKILKWSVLIALLLSASLSYTFAWKAIMPFTRLINNVKSIDFDKLTRLTEVRRKDEIGQLAESINEMLERLERAFKNQEKFVANASHELRTPLAVLIAEATYILNHSGEPEKYKAHINVMLKDLKRLNSLTDSLLELSRLKRDTSMSTSPVQVDEVIYNVVPELKTKFRNNKIITKVNFSDNEHDLTVEGNKSLMEIAFRNIIENACKFSQDEVLIEITPSEKFVTVSVTDKGVGIPRLDIDGIFDTFSRGSNVRQKRGFGIGLSIVSRIADLHKARIKVESEDNKGTRFELKFFKTIKSEE